MNREDAKRMRLIAALAAAALSVTACSGGGSSTTGGPDPMPVNVSLTDVTPGYTALAAGTLDIAAGASTDHGDVTFMCAAGGDDCAVTVAAGGTVTAVGGMVTAMNSRAYQARLDEAAAARVAAVTKASLTKESAIAAEAAQTADDGPGGADATTDHAITITRDGAGTTVTIAVDGAAADDPTFMQAMDLGGGRTMHVRTMPADANGSVTEEVMVVGTDIEAPTATPFAMVPEQALNADADGAAATGADAVAFDPGGALDSSSPRDAAVLAKVMSTAFASGTGATLTFGGDDPGDPTDAAFTTAGSYNGAPGTYKCAGGAADCTVTLDAMGTLIAMSDDWIFTPDSGATSDVPDADYLHYGFWLQRTTDAMDAVTYDEVETFAASSVAASGDVSSVTGSATYRGGAAGVYVNKVFNADGTLDRATSGHFAADATLTATFGQVLDAAGLGTIAPNLLNTLGGTIDNFRLSGGEANTWSVALDGDITANSGMASGTARGGVAGVDGSFSAAFHGPVTDADNDPVQPHTVVGEFNADFSNGAVAGAFGARKTME
ncbi:MAG: transferrin-binding protein-like solute binding protein [Gammaproteobacteria bacterium]|nr:transferrin-binding protein-like solute binding protein [Gammaproteobacteria bacterium]